jgi:hypothetical protein
MKVPADPSVPVAAELELPSPTATVTPPPTRRPYTPPTLRRLGTVRELTGDMVSTHPGFPRHP